MADCLEMEVRPGQVVVVVYNRAVSAVSAVCDVLVVWGEISSAAASGLLLGRTGRLHTVMGRLIELCQQKRE